jgi:hypothetical protein
VTYVDTIIVVVLMTGASLMMALLFASTVLSFKWWSIFFTHRRRSGDDKLRKVKINGKQVLLHAGIKVKSQSQNLVQLKRLSSWSELKNKKVKTCEMADIGNIIAIDKQSMTVIHETNQEYIIPTYYIREYNTENVVTDISIRYLHLYKVDGIHSNLQK